MGVSIRWTEMWNGTVERWNGGTVERWNGGTVERWNGKWIIVHSDCVAGTVQSRLSYLL